MPVSPPHRISEVIKTSMAIHTSNLPSILMGRNGRRGRGLLTASVAPGSMRDFQGVMWNGIEQNRACTSLASGVHTCTCVGVHRVQTINGIPGSLKIPSVSRSLECLWITPGWACFWGILAPGKSEGTCVSRDLTLIFTQVSLSKKL